MTYPVVADNGSWPGAPSSLALGPIGVAGGLRDRFIFNSLWECINASLGGLGWFNATRYDTPPGVRQNRPVTLTKEQVNWDVEIVPNTIAFAPEDVSDPGAWELGSDYRENRWGFYCTVIAESEPVSIQLAGDIRDILRGKLPEVGRGGGPFVDVFRWDAATPYKLTYLEIEHVAISRMPSYSQKWQRYMRDVRWEALDYYDSSEDSSDWAFSP